MSAELLFVLSIAASAIVWLLKVVFVDKGQEVPAWVYTIVLGVVSLVLALVFSPVALPPFPANDGSLLGILAALLTFAGALLPIISAIVGFATLIYQALLKRILDALGKKVKKLVAGSDIG